jgi:hypothetical protein
MTNWYDQPLHHHAQRGGEVGVDGKLRRGGEFEPFYVPRSVMPQVDEADMPALLRWVSVHGCSVTEVVRSADQLRFHQRVEMSRVVSMPSEVYEKPLLISRDGYVLDGNHRATAHKLKGEPADCMMIDADFQRAMQLLFSFAKTYTYGDGKTHAAY